MAPQNRCSAHPELATERLDADLAAGTVTIIVKEKGTYKCVGVATETGAAQFFHRPLATQNQASAARPTNKTQATKPEPARRSKSIMQFRETIWISNR